MTIEEKFKKLQAFYAAVIAESISNYEKYGIIEKVTEDKTRENRLTASNLNKQLGITTPEELFSIYSELFGSIKWNLSEKDNVLTATGSFCMFEAMAKKSGAKQPCYIYCINPIKEMVKNLEPSFGLVVKETLWDNKKCTFELIKT